MTDKLEEGGKKRKRSKGASFLSTLKKEGKSVEEKKKGEGVDCYTK